MGEFLAGGVELLLGGKLGLLLGGKLGWDNIFGGRFCGWGGPFCLDSALGFG